MRIQQERAASTEQARPVANAEDVMSIKRRRHIYETRRGVVANHETGSLRGLHVHFHPEAAEPAGP